MELFVRFIAARNGSSRRPRLFIGAICPMEFVVTSLNDSGFGTLRWAIDQANAWAGDDSISFDSRLTGGTVGLMEALPAVSDRVSILGLMNAQNQPQIMIDFNGYEGLRFTGALAERSNLKGLSLVDSGGTALTLDASRIQVQNTYVGLSLDGMTAIANAEHGILITNRSHHNLIGTLDPLTGEPLDLQFSNVISANGGSGIEIQGGSNNRIANNRIGTTADGKQDRGNGGHGIHLTNGSKNNFIGGIASTGNNPTQGQFARPGQGNLVSGNALSGVQIDTQSTGNTLSGNFIGTDSRGTSAIANDGDGVSIINSNGNILRGTTRNLQPFIYYNVVSGNGGNGLRVFNSNNTVIHANFFGLGSDNQTIVANGSNGALIEGTSANTQYGGVIPLGNVNAGNVGNGILVADQAKGFISFNTFAGLTAFGGIAPNQLSGIAISSRGGNTQIRTNVMSGNLLHGLHITGDARDVWVDPNIIGLDSYGTAAVDSNTGVSWENRIDGIRVDGNASDIRISGNRRSVIPQNTISNNRGYGIRVIDQARNVVIENSFVGLSSTGKTVYGNGLGGVFVGESVNSLRLGNPKSKNYPNRVVGNSGNGITLSGLSSAQLYFNLAASNGGSGIALIGGQSNILVGNIASSNMKYGFEQLSSSNNIFRLNSGKDNTLGLYS